MDHPVIKGLKAEGLLPEHCFDVILKFPADSIVTITYKIFADERLANIVKDQYHPTKQDEERIAAHGHPVPRKAQ